MNKTVSINLGGFFFHIDENAYQKLNSYFDAIRRSLAPDGREEIMSDIEGRIAELLGEKLKSDKQVVSIREIEEVIAIMGEPEDYRIDDDGPAQYASQGGYYSTPGYMPPPRKRKFYRDGDQAIISGVCAGISHYYNMDPLWVRIIFVILLFLSFGTGLFIYVLLWILIPKAITTTEKLEMTGEPINISNIERKVREEFDALGKRLNSVDYEKMGNDAKRGAERVGNGLGKVFMAIFKGFAKVIGALITIFAAVGLVAVLIFFITMLFTSSLPGAGWGVYADGINYTDTPIWIVAVLGLFAAAIPLLALFLLGLKILVENLRSIGNTAKITLLLLWVISVAGLVYFGVSEANEISSRDKTITREAVNVSTADTLNIKFKYNPYHAKSWFHETDFRITQDQDGNEILYSNNVSIHIMKTDEAQPYLQIEKVSLGSSISEARKRSEFINYHFEVEGNTLILDNYLTTGREHKYRNQSVELYLYLPEGTYFHPDMSVKEYDWSDNDFFDLWYDSENTYLVKKDRVECLNCVEPQEHDDEDWDVYTDGDTTIEGDGNNVDIKSDNAHIKITRDSVSIQAIRK